MFIKKNDLTPWMFHGIRPLYYSSRLKYINKSSLDKTNIFHANELTSARMHMNSDNVFMPMPSIFASSVIVKPTPRELERNI